MTILDLGSFSGHRAKGRSLALVVLFYSFLTYPIPWMHPFNGIFSLEIICKLQKCPMPTFDILLLLLLLFFFYFFFLNFICCLWESGSSNSTVGYTHKKWTLWTREEKRWTNWTTEKEERRKQKQNNLFMQPHHSQRIHCMSYVPTQTRRNINKLTIGHSRHLLWPRTVIERSLHCMWMVSELHQMDRKKQKEKLNTQQNQNWTWEVQVWLITGPITLVTQWDTTVDTESGGLE